MPLLLLLLSILTVAEMYHDHSGWTNNNSGWTSTDGTQTLISQRPWKEKSSHDLQKIAAASVNDNRVHSAHATHTSSAIDSIHHLTLAGAIYQMELSHIQEFFLKETRLQYRGVPSNDKVVIPRRKLYFLAQYHLAIRKEDELELRGARPLIGALEALIVFSCSAVIGAL